MSTHPQQRLSLAQLQRKMIDTLYGAEPDPALLHSVRGRAGLTSRSLLAIYRSGTQAALMQALRISYPVVERLVGLAFFGTAASAHVTETPSRSGDLEHYGADFGSFLDRYGPAAALPYLGDVARLEWLVSRLQRAPVVKPLDRERLMAIPHDALGELRLVLSPRAALFQSRYPAFRIWQENRDRSRDPDPVSLEEGSDRLLIVIGDAVTAQALSEAEHAFYRCCDRGAGLAEMLEAGLAEDAGFDLATMLLQTLKSAALCVETRPVEDANQWG